MVLGILFTTAWRTTVAIQSTNCDVIWKSLYEPEEPEEPEVYNVNRGVAYADGKGYGRRSVTRL